MTVIRFLSFLTFTLPLALRVSALPILPNGAGYGIETVAGSGRHLKPATTSIYRVTNLNDSGAGSLRGCIETKTPRVCIFEVSGRIQLKSLIRIKYPYITIAGQTAPSPGIVLAGNGIRVQTHNVLIQHLQVLFGDKLPTSDRANIGGISIGSATTHNVVVDHCSVAWALDENVGTWFNGTRDVTISNTIMAEGLDCSVHPDGCHSTGLMVGVDSKRVSLSHNLIASNFDRNPAIKPGATGEFINNLVYNWGPNSQWDLLNVTDTGKIGRPILFSVIGNFYKPGPKSYAKGKSIHGAPPASGTRIYVNSNVGPGRTVDQGSDWAFAGIPEKPHRALGPPIPLSGVTPLKPSDTYNYVLKNAGSRPWERNVIDTRIIQEVKLNTGSIKDCVTGCAKNAGGWPSVSSQKRALTIPANPLQVTSTGYTVLELWLHSFEKPGK
jgi:hypothetical protein